MRDRPDPGEPYERHDLIEMRNHGRTLAEHYVETYVQGGHYAALLIDARGMPREPLPLPRSLRDLRIAAGLVGVAEGFWDAAQRWEPSSTREDERWPDDDGRR